VFILLWGQYNRPSTVQLIQGDGNSKNKQEKKKEIQKLEGKMRGLRRSIRTEIKIKGECGE
jgi:hypothetical protein